MQFPKFMPLVCAVVFCWGFISARAEDNPAQAAARAALEAKMHDLDTQPASANTETLPAAATIIIPVPTEAETPAATATIHADNAQADSADQSRALDALQQKMRELNAQQPSANTEASSAITIPLPAAVVTEQPARAAEIQTAKTAPLQVPAVASPPAPPTPNYPGKDLGLKQIAAPPLPVSADVQAQLQALLLQYKADQISPEEYHKRRAAILGQP